MIDPEQRHPAALERFLAEHDEVRQQLDHLNPLLAQAAGMTAAQYRAERLHEAFDVLLTGTIRVRGRVWVASRPEHALWIESAGGGLQIGMAGRWLAGSLAWDDVDEMRRAPASLRRDERWGDRQQQHIGRAPA